MSRLFVRIHYACPAPVHSCKSVIVVGHKCWPSVAHPTGSSYGQKKMIASIRAARDKGSEQEAGSNDSLPGPPPIGSSALSEQEVAFRRRMVLGLAVAAVLGLGANFVGITSALLGLNAQLARQLKLDVVYPVKGFKRCIENSKGFEFVYPASWVGDQRLLYRAVERAERERFLDLPALQGNARPRKAVTEPIVAFGPPGSDGSLNVSVVVAPVYSGFRLEQLGTPEDAGRLLLGKFIAPEGSDKVASLRSAEKRDDLSGVSYYTLEYTVETPTFYRHNLAVYASSNGLLFSLNSQAPEATWSSVKERFQETAASFSLLV